MQTGLTISVILLIVNIVNLALYGMDKYFAIQKMYRIPERVLLTVSMLGGGIGGLAAMNFFRHKTHKWYFWAVNIVGTVVALLLLFLLTGTKFNLDDFLP